MTVYSQFQTLRAEKEDKVLIVTLNRPDSLNAITWQMHGELEDLFARLVTDKEVNAVVLTGAGRAFCAGGDVRGMAANLDDETTRFGKTVSTMIAARRVFVNMLEVEQPIIAAVNGDALAFGATLALFCDVVIAADTARISDAHVRMGIVAGDGGAVIWPLLVGVSRAKELLMTGDFISAREAERMGLVSRVLPPADVLPAAKELAHRLANGPILAIKWTKVSVNRQVRERLNLLLDSSLTLEYLSMLSGDHKEAARAFVEKRPPSFKGW